MTNLIFVADSRGLNGVTVALYLSQAIVEWVTTETHTNTSWSGTISLQSASPNGHPWRYNSAILKGAAIKATPRSAKAIVPIKKPQGFLNCFNFKIVPSTDTLPRKPNAKITEKNVMTIILYVRGSKSSPWCPRTLLSFPWCSMVRFGSETSVLEFLKGEDAIYYLND